VTHGEKMARAALKRWLDHYREQETCAKSSKIKGCISTHHARCEKHTSSTKQLVRDTEMLLESGPN